MAWRAAWRSLPTLDKDELFIGRDAECDIVLSAEQVSKRHARVFRVGDAFCIEDLKSTNSTWVNGIALLARQRLHDDDVIKIGRFTLVYSDIVAPRVGTTILGTIDLPAMAREASRHRAEEKLRVISEIAGELIGVLDLECLVACGEFSTSFFRIFPQVDRGFVLLADEASDLLRIKARKLSDAEPGRSMPSRTVYDHVMGQGTAILCENVDEIDFLDSPSVGMSRVASIMCAPLLDRRRRPVGIIQVDTQDPSRTFAHDDLDFLEPRSPVRSAWPSKAPGCMRSKCSRNGRSKRHEMRATCNGTFSRNIAPMSPATSSGTSTGPPGFVGGDYLDYFFDWRAGSGRLERTPGHRAGRSCWETYRARGCPLRCSWRGSPPNSGC